MIVTDAPIDHRTCSVRGAPRGLARTGSTASTAAGDASLFNCSVRISRNQKSSVTLLANDAMSPLFLAVIEATEEAIYNSLFRATTTTGRGHTVEALPIDKTLEVLRRHNALKQ